MSFVSQKNPIKCKYTPNSFVSRKITRPSPNPHGQDVSFVRTAQGDRPGLGVESGLDEPRGVCEKDAGGDFDGVSSISEGNAMFTPVFPGHPDTVVPFHFFANSV